MIITADGAPRFEDGADRGRIIVSGEQTDGRYALMEWIVAPSQPTSADEPPGFGAHLHRECEETFLIRSGALEFMLGDKVTTIGPGDFVRVPPGMRHGYRNVSGEPVDMVVGFHPAGLELLFLKHRTDQDPAPHPEGFINDATQFHASVFEV